MAAALAMYMSGWEEQAGSSLPLNFEPISSLGQILDGTEGVQEISRGAPPVPVWDDFPPRPLFRKQGDGFARGKKPVWDEASGCFWISTSVNAYDIPDGRVWQKGFHEALTFHEPNFFTARRHLTNMHRPITAMQEKNAQNEESSNKENAGVSQNRSHAGERILGRRMSSPITPKRLPPRGRGLRESPKTPPLFRAASPLTRSLRATHTKALLSMKEKAGVSAVVQGREVAFFRFGGEVFAVAAKCPHQGGNLCEGEIGDIEDLDGDCKTAGRAGKQTYVTCPVHKMQFDLRDGGVIDGSCAPLQTYKVRIADVDEVRKVAPVEISFDSLDENYFGDLVF